MTRPEPQPFRPDIARLSLRQLRKLVTTAAMNVTRVEADDEMSVFFAVSSGGGVGWDWEGDEDGIAFSTHSQPCGETRWQSKIDVGGFAFSKHSITPFGMT